MGASLSNFCLGRTDVDKNGQPDNVQAFEFVTNLIAHAREETIPVADNRNV